ncbi:Teneurin-2 [Triplophysa tibetana]|uniref:Teneurin-2 n=1 Tax=Triplophysa tibetana TaxID=1572043 RepID=A0A5A9PEL0_9TELE|nr:Teneurin-2 [Triplophysa tibetana]
MLLGDALLANTVKDRVNRNHRWAEADGEMKRRGRTPTKRIKREEDRESLAEEMDEKKEMALVKGRPLPPTPSSSLLPPAPPPPSAPLHQTATSIRECQMPLLDSGSSHAILDPPPDDEFSPNSYLLRAQPPTTDEDKDQQAERKGFEADEQALCRAHIVAPSPAVHCELPVLYNGAAHCPSPIPGLHTEAPSAVFSHVNTIPQKLFSIEGHCHTRPFRASFFCGCRINFQQTTPVRLEKNKERRLGHGSALNTLKAQVPPAFCSRMWKVAGPALMGASSHHSHTSLRPPLPPPHNHHQSLANSLNRGSQASRRNPQSHAPAAAPPDGPSTPESVQLQDSWALNSSVPLETRHFLFKTPSGSTPLFSSSSPGYPLTSGTVYSPPPRLLPRNTFSRSSFKLKKPSKYCSWKCAAVSAIAAAVLLAILLSYVIAKQIPTQRGGRSRSVRTADVYFRRQRVIHLPFDMSCDSDVLGKDGFGLIKASLCRERFLVSS